MEEFFNRKYSSIIKSKRNKQKIFRFLESNTKNQNELFISFYELYVEYSLQPNLHSLYELMKQKQFVFTHDHFRAEKDLIEEENAFIENPPTISEGIIQCRVCKQNSTISYEKQTRSGDEQSTIFVYCNICKRNFKL